MNSLVSQFLFLVQVSRPIIWPVLPLVYALGMHAAHAHLTGPAIGQLLMLTFPMSLVGCGLNDIYDYESDRHSSRRRAIWGTVVTPTERTLVFSACVAMIPLVIFSACLTRNRDNFMATVSLVVIAIAWIVVRPLLGIVILVLAVGGFIYTRKLAAASKPAKPAKPSAKSGRKA